MTDSPREISPSCKVINDGDDDVDDDGDDDADDDVDEEDFPWQAPRW